jgi:hypothetical protein
MFHLCYFVPLSMATDFFVLYPLIIILENLNNRNQRLIKDKQIHVISIFSPLS